MPDSDRQVAKWRNTVFVAAVASLLVRFLFPPIGVVLFMATTVMAATRFRQMPVVTVLVATVTVLAATSMPASFLAAHHLSAGGTTARAR